LSLLFGPIAMWDLRLLGLGRRIPIRAMHALVPWAIGGFALTAVSGVTFLMAEPTEYIYNPAFQFKMLFLTLAGVNALLFYPTVGRCAMAGAPGDDAPAAAKLMALASLSFWIAVIVCGRLLTFYRPAWCDAHPAGWLLACVPLSMR
jgi:hypothetical protein